MSRCSQSLTVVQILFKPRILQTKWTLLVALLASTLIWAFEDFSLSQPHLTSELREIFRWVVRTKLASCRRFRIRGLHGHL